MKTNNKLNILLSFLFTLFCVHTQGQTIHTADSYKMDRSVPAGNYSGIVAINGQGDYALVDDKCKTDGFYVFNITLDSITGKVCRITNKGFRSARIPNRDEEGIAFNALSQRIYISGEKDNCIQEYTIDGETTSKTTPCLLPQSKTNSGLEALCYDPYSNCLWTIEENNGNDSCTIIRISMSDLKETERYMYALDKPEAKKKAQWHTNGVSSVLVLDSTHFLVLERELFVPKKKIGAWAHVKLYSYPIPHESNQNHIPSSQHKVLIWSERTKLNLTARSYANYEGMSWGPTLHDGRKTLLIVADSQARYKGVLHDWLKVLTLSTSHFSFSNK